MWICNLCAHRDICEKRKETLPKWNGNNIVVCRWIVAYVSHLIARISGIEKSIESNNWNNNNNKSNKPNNWFVPCAICMTHKTNLYTFLCARTDISLWNILISVEENIRFGPGIVAIHLFPWCGLLGSAFASFTLSCALLAFCCCCCCCLGCVLFCWPKNWGPLWHPVGNSKWNRKMNAMISARCLSI